MTLKIEFENQLLAILDLTCSTEFNSNQKSIGLNLTHK